MYGEELCEQLPTITEIPSPAIVFAGDGSHLNRRNAMFSSTVSTMLRMMDVAMGNMKLVAAPEDVARQLAEERDFRREHERQSQDRNCHAHENQRLAYTVHIPYTPPS